MKRTGEAVHIIEKAGRTGHRGDPLNEQVCQLLITQLIEEGVIEDEEHADRVEQAQEEEAAVARLAEKEARKEERMRIHEETKLERSLQARLEAQQANENKIINKHLNPKPKSEKQIAHEQRVAEARLAKEQRKMQNIQNNQFRNNQGRNKKREWNGNHLNHTNSQQNDYGYQ